MLSLRRLKAACFGGQYKKQMMRKMGITERSTWNAPFVHQRSRKKTFLDFAQCFNSGVLLK